MGNVHILYPSMYREPASRFRERFPGPWTVDECANGYLVLDAQGARLLTIETSHQDRPNRLPPLQALMLACAIARMGD